MVLYHFTPMFPFNIIYCITRPITALPATQLKFSELVFLLAGSPRSAASYWPEDTAYTASYWPVLVMGLSTSGCDERS